jgi:hypothetical protein
MHIILFIFQSFTLFLFYIFTFFLYLRPPILELPPMEPLRTPPPPKPPPREPPKLPLLCEELPILLFELLDELFEGV